jgi:hypothetical protein
VNYFTNCLPFLFEIQNQPLYNNSMNLPKPSRRLRLWLAVILLILALGLLAYSAFPPVHVQQVMPMPPVILPSPTPISLLDVLTGV